MQSERKYLEEGSDGTSERPLWGSGYGWFGLNVNEQFLDFVIASVAMRRFASGIGLSCIRVFY
jgi:hypothetical protein